MIDDSFFPDVGHCCLMHHKFCIVMVLFMTVVCMGLGITHLYCKAS
jgi:hypothetical protein